MERNILLFFLLVFNGSIYCQNLHNLDSTEKKIQKLRSQVFAKQEILPSAQLAEVFSKLKNSEDKKHLSLSQEERWMLDYCLGDYEDILNTVLSFDSSNYSVTYWSKLRPVPDSLNLKLSIYLRSKQISICNDIDNTDYSFDERDFLKLNLQFCLPDLRKPIIFRDTLNVRANNFLLENPGSKYSSFTSKYIYARMVPSKLAIGLYLGIGTTQLSRAVANHIWSDFFGAIGFELSVGRICLNYHLQSGTASVYHEFSLNNRVWPQRLDLDLGLNEFSIGYSLLDSRFFRLMPYMGIASFQLTPTEREKIRHIELENSRIKMAAYSLGLTADFKFNLHINDSYLGSHNYNRQIIRIRYAYGFPSKNVSGNIGPLSYLTIGTALQWRGVVLAR